MDATIHLRLMAGNLTFLLPCHVCQVYSTSRKPEPQDRLAFKLLTPQTTVHGPRSERRHHDELTFESSLKKDASAR
jgi:hypothetical protein